MILRTRFLIQSITLAATLLAGDAIDLSASDDKPFQAGKAADYSHQTAEQVTVAAKAFGNEDLTAEAFGKKADLLKYGVLPILVVVENQRGKTVDLHNIEVSLVGADGRHVTSVSPEDIAYLGTAGKRHSSTPVSIGLPVPLPKKKNPLSAPEIVARAFAAKMVPPGDSVSGFFYFEARPEAGDTIYVNGLRDARSGKEIIYFEFPLDKEAPAK